MYAGTDGRKRCRYNPFAYSALKGGGQSAPCPCHFTPETDPVPVPTFHGAVWALGLFWTGMENLAPTGFRSPARPV